MRTRAREQAALKAAEAPPLSGRALSREGTPTLHAVYRGHAADELVLVDDRGRAILLKGDGLTLEESIWMCDRAITLLRGTDESTPEPSPIGVQAP
jgi:hypothetical protein